MNITSPFRAVRDRTARRGRPSVVSFSGGDWWVHGRAYANVQVMVELARQRPVLIVNSIGLRAPKPTSSDGGRSGFAKRVKGKLKSLAKGVRRPIPDRMLWVYTPFFLPAFSPRALAFNSRFIAWQVRVVCRLLGLSETAVMVTNPVMHQAAQRLHPTRLVYYRSDRHASAPSIDQAFVRRCEDELFRSAEAICYSNDVLRQDEFERHHGKGVTVDHGVDTEHFRPDGPKAAIPPAKGQVIGYFGQIESSSLDVDLVTKVAREYPEHTVVVIGRVVIDVSEWHALPNVVVMGMIPYDVLPSYARNFDVALLPMPRDDWNVGVNPLKLKEYLSLGLPVVAIRFPELERYRPVVTLVEDHDEFITAVGDALDGKHPATAEQRRAFVMPHGWHTRAAMVGRILDGEPAESNG